MEKKIYLLPVTKKLSLDVSGGICSEPVPVSDVPVYAGPDPIEPIVENIF